MKTKSKFTKRYQNWFSKKFVFFLHLSSIIFLKNINFAFCLSKHNLLHTFSQSSYILTQVLTLPFLQVVTLPNPGSNPT